MYTRNENIVPVSVDYSPKTFKQFFFQSPMKRYWVYTIAISIFNWILFKFFYPHPNLIFDSYYYVLAAVKQDGVSIWPIGYSKFISIIGSISHSANFLLTVQYIILQGSFIVFFYSIIFLFGLSRYSSNFLFILLFLNPIYLYGSNLVLSDTLFLSLSLLWIINLLWILFNPQPWMVITQALLLIFTFTLRHSAMFYPLIGVMAILFSRYRLIQKCIGIGLQILFVTAFILYTTHINKERYGSRQFSPFEGWKLASNALYFYEHIPDNHVKVVPPKLQKLDTLVRAYYHSKHDVQSLFKQDPSWGSYYMFNYPSPLLVYKDRMFRRISKLHIDQYTFSKLGPIYDYYGKFLILNYPAEYFKRVVLPNSFFYLFPYPEVFIDTLNPFKIQLDSVGMVTREWFKIDDISAATKVKEFRQSIFSYYSAFNTLTHLFFVFLITTFFYYKSKIVINAQLSQVLLLIIIFWVVNFIFIIISSASLLRYQLFIVIIEQAFSLIIWDRLKKQILS